ncbi:D-sedoheptulose-7-phosphate isomerase [Pacificibacter marinus]|uniref:D-sedoheptulose-7-phosphate isomerase n=1 Tax=Pacificibacter marinus TaxID=658057 RepID=UPI00339D4D58
MKDIKKNLERHIEVVQALCADETQLENIQKSIEVSLESLKAGKKLLFCGNGGSASDSQHLATELTIRFIGDRPAIAAIALTTDTSALTAAGNDIGFDRVFSRQVEALGQEGDVLMAFSTSGNSANIVKAVEEAQARGMKVVFFGGGTGGKIAGMADVSLIVPSKITAHIQECHILIGHILCGGIESGLGYAD